MRQKDRVGLKLKILSNIFDQRMNQKVAALDLTSTQSFVLGHIVRSEKPQCQRDIEKRFNMKHPTVNGVIQRLEDKGFISCRVDENDKRLKLISPTEKSIEHHKMTMDAILDTNEELVSGLSQEELDTLQQLLDKMLDSLGVPRPPEPEKQED